MNRKAQIAGQVFIFMLAAAMAVLIIIYGYRAISGFTSKTEEIALINLKTDMQNEVRTIASDYGSVKRLDISLPGDYSKLCLIDLSKRNMASGSCLCTYGCDDYEPEICDAWQTAGNEDNAFLVPIFPMKLSSMEIDGGYTCITPRKSTLSLRLEGKGDRTHVSEWSV